MIAEIAGKRAALFGRAPVIGDVDVAVALLGYDGSADPEFVEMRARARARGRRTTTTAAASIVDAVPEELLRLRADRASPNGREWRTQARPASTLFPELRRQPT